MKQANWLIIFFLILLLHVPAHAQKIKLDVNGVSLNTVLIELRDSYGIQFAFDDKLLSRFSVTAKMEFNNKEAAVSYLLSGLPLSFEKSGEIFVVFPDESKTTASKKTITTRVGGQVVESGTYEPLPFSYIIINNHQVQSDQNGNFNFLASSDTSFTMQISHLGYFVYDTLFNNSLNQKFFLKPSVKELEEVKVEGNTVERSTLIGDAPGQMKINHTIAPYLPGFGDNSVYNILRLMPGVLASGEQSSDLLIWGSNEGQSKLELDGFTIFGLKNYNDNIGVVNPLLIKNIRVLKGGYEANYGDRVGGIIQITGKNGNQAKPALTLNINNSTINSMIELPVGKKSLILAAYRHTYYNFYNPYDLNLFGKRNMDTTTDSADMHRPFNNMVDVLVIPDYKFGDANFKYSFSGNNGDIFSASFYRGGDKYSYKLEGEYGTHQINNSQSETNKQSGASLNYGKTWSKNKHSLITISYSGLNSINTETNSFLQGMQHGMGNSMTNQTRVKNGINEFSAEIKNNFSLLNGNQIDAGLGYQFNDIVLEQTNNEIKNFNLNNQSENIFFFAQGILPVTEKFRIKPGVRNIYSTRIGKFYIEPKLEASFNISELLKLNASWGQYHQFISKTSFVDKNSNYLLHWTASDDITIPVLSSTHWVSGISYNKNDFLLSVEGYYKQTSGVTRYYNGAPDINNGFYSGKNRSYGLDFYIKKEYKKNVVWVSYTLSKTEENLALTSTNGYQLAPQDQRHEIKFAGIYNLKKFYFSADYVYGSGFEIMKNFIDENTGIPIYSRLDVAVIYKFNKGILNGNLGFSVLNVLNKSNIKYSNLKRIETDTTELINIHSEAVPFTPTLFLKISI